MVNIQLYPTLLYEFIQVLMMILCFLSDTFDSNILLHPLFIDNVELLNHYSQLYTDSNVDSII